MDVLQAAGVVLAAVLILAGAVTTVGGAIEKIVKVVRAAKAPDNKQNDRISALEQWRETVDRKLENDNHRLEAFAADTRVLQLGVLALLDHGIDGNNIQQMQTAKEELQTHLINK